MTVIPMHGVKEAPRDKRSQTATLVLKLDDLKGWVVPPFQRPLRENQKVRDVAEQLKDDGGVISGIITIGQLPKDETQYLMDGQHRRLAAVLSGLDEFLMDVRFMHFDSMADMAKEFVKLNSHIVKMTPDDVLRGLEGSLRPLQIIRNKCLFVGYGHIRLGGESNASSPMLGMSAALRQWRGSSFETPSASAGKSSPDIAQELTHEEAEGLAKFLNLVYSVWLRDVENHRLWSALNMTICMWLWRRLVVDTERAGSRRYAVLSADHFRKCLHAVAANHEYKDWLVGRQMTDRDRAPCYKRLRMLFTQRLSDEGIKNVRLPQPQWVKG